MMCKFDGLKNLEIENIEPIVWQLLVILYGWNFCQL